ncbi:AAA family ATPase [Draconibacterium orientale]|uniref:ATP-dependent nuclease n=1 Tax=Draconibacterium orientale TaxID=1168034 RepID=UPI0029C03422|nr:AAA family ATPase [Draconibacterium orientale]
MYLSKLKLWNFRKYGNGDHLNSITNETKPDLVVEFKPKLNVLIGENDSGKTAIIDAIKYVLNTKSLDYLRLEDKDFHEHVVYENGEIISRIRATSLRIECKFNDLQPSEAGSFLEWVGFDVENNYELTIWLSANRTKENRIIANIKAGADDAGIQLDGEARENLKVTYLKPLRDALSELTPGYKSRLAQILGGHDVFKTKATDSPEEKWKHELEIKAKNANDIIRDYFKIKKEGSNDGGIITEGVLNNLKALSFDGFNAEPAFEITDEELMDILKTLKLVNDSNKAGLGSLNKLYMAAEFLLLKQSKGRELQLALIEEIEAHLHPQAQLKVIDAIQNNKNLNKGQLIITTHSTTLTSKVKLDNLILCHGNNVYPMFNDGKHTKLDQGDYEFLERFLDATKANLFFAKGVIMVEGDAENILIPTIAEIIGRPLHNYGVSIVNVGSTAFMRYAKIFQRRDGKFLDIPVACITDLDVSLKRTKEGEIVPKKGNSIDYHSEMNSKQKKSIEAKHSKVKVFMSSLWTLEFDILNSESCTSELLYRSILEAKLIKSRDKKYLGLNEKDVDLRKKMASNQLLEMKKTLDIKQIAFRIFSKYFSGNDSISKAITAQRFVYHLLQENGEVNTILKTAPEFNYIREAIYHVTKQPEK